MLDCSSMGNPRLIGGKYQLQDLIDKGGMGEVWRATNLQIDREVAIKLIIKQAAEELKLGERLIREAKVIGGLRHSNIVDVLDAGKTEDGAPFLVMELLIGETLRKLLDRRFMLEPVTAAQIGRCVASALTAAHEAHIVHRDLKPANIFLHRKPGVDGVTVKVVDFGISKRLDASDGTLTAPDNWVGTMPYMSPEQLLTPKRVDARSDIWSLGVVIFEMISGVKPFRGDQGELLHRILRAEIPRISDVIRDVPPKLDDLVARCMVRDREHRIGTAKELAVRLQEFAGPGEAVRIYAGPITHLPGTSRVQSLFDRTMTSPSAPLNSNEESSKVPAPSGAVAPADSGGSELMVDPFKVARELPALKYQPPPPLSRGRSQRTEPAGDVTTRVPTIDSALIDDVLQDIDVDASDEEETIPRSIRHIEAEAMRDQRAQAPSQDPVVAESVRAYAIEVEPPDRAGAGGRLGAKVRGDAARGPERILQPAAAPDAGAPPKSEKRSGVVPVWRARLERVVRSDVVAVSSVVAALVIAVSVGAFVVRVSRPAPATRMETLHGNPALAIAQQCSVLVESAKAPSPPALPSKPVVSSKSAAPNPKPGNEIYDELSGKSQAPTAVLPPKIISKPAAQPASPVMPAPQKPSAGAAAKPGVKCGNLIKVACKKYNPGAP